MFSPIKNLTALGLGLLSAMVLGFMPMTALASPHGNITRDIVLKAGDGKKVYGTYTKAPEKHRGIILLFHQAHANRHEYDPIVPRLTAMGFDTLAIDQRSGDHMFGHGNVTVEHRGGSADYLAAYADLEGALAWAKKKGYKTIITVGSSYSSALNILLAAKHPHDITAAAAFSPGEYFDNKNKIKNAAKKVQIPFYVTAEPNATGEKRLNDVLAKAAHKQNITRYLPKHGVHGASTLRRDRDPKGYKTNFKHFKAFLNKAT